MNKLYNFAEYDLIEDRNKNNYIYRGVIILLIIGISIIICRFKFYIYQESVLLNENNNYLIVADINTINTLSTSRKIVINNKKYSFNINSADNYEIINGTIYQYINLDIKNYHSNIRVLKCYFLKSKITLLDSITKFIRGG